ncbi:MAG: hypothetical protein GX471_08455 [Candidatus Microthrix parvicella]|nr:hypothetical protein [Candidatus Microthrix parvicella]
MKADDLREPATEGDAADEGGDAPCWAHLFADEDPIDEDPIDEDLVGDDDPSAGGG